MPNRTEPQWQVEGMVNAAPEGVWTALLGTQPTLTDADREGILNQPGSETWRVSRGEPMQGRITIEANNRERWIATQGEWWYRGVLSVEPSENGSRIRYRVYNIAPGIGWWAAQLVQGPQNTRHMDSQMADLVRAIEARLKG